MIFPITNVGLLASSQPIGNAPVNVTLPNITYDTMFTLTCDEGTWDDRGFPITSYAYQWFRDGAELPGETANTLTLPPDTTATWKCEVTATNSEGSRHVFSPDENITTSDYIAPEVVQTGVIGPETLQGFNFIYPYTQAIWNTHGAAIIRRDIHWYVNGTYAPTRDGDMQMLAQSVSIGTSFQVKETVHVSGGSVETWSNTQTRAR